MHVLLLIFMIHQSKRKKIEGLQDEIDDLKDQMEHLRRDHRADSWSSKAVFLQERGKYIKAEERIMFVIFDTKTSVSKIMFFSLLGLTYVD